jgi:hypothetical protein
MKKMRGEKKMTSTLADMGGSCRLRVPRPNLAVFASGTHVFPVARKTGFNAQFLVHVPTVYPRNLHQKEKIENRSMNIYL